MRVRWQGLLDSEVRGTELWDALSPELLLCLSTKIAFKVHSHALSPALPSAVSMLACPVLHMLLPCHFILVEV